MATIMSKKSQVTAFIALGLTLLLIAVLLVHMVTKLKVNELTVALEEQQLRARLTFFIDSCLQTTSLKAVREFGLDEGTSGPFIAQYITGQLPSCLDDFAVFREEGFGVEASDMTVTAEVNPETLVIDMTFPVSLTKENIVLSMDEFSFVFLRKNSVTIREGEETYLLSTDQRIEITVPAGVEVWKDGTPVTIIELRVLDHHFDGLSNDVLAGMVAYDAGPRGVTFSAPVSIVYKYDDKDVPNTIQETDLRIGYYDSELGTWLALPTEVDPVKNLLSAETMHFTAFGAVLRCQEEQDTILFISPTIMKEDCSPCEGWSLDVPDTGNLGIESKEVTRGNGLGEGDTCSSETDCSGCATECPDDCKKMYFYYDTPDFSRSRNAEITFADDGDACLWTEEGREPTIVVSDTLGEVSEDILLVANCSEDDTCGIPTYIFSDSTLSYTLTGENRETPVDACLQGTVFMRFTGFGIDEENSYYECSPEEEGTIRDDLPVIGGSVDDVTSAVCNCSDLGGGTEVCLWQEIPSNESECNTTGQYSGKCFTVSGSIDTRNRDFVDKFGDFPEMQYRNDMSFNQETPLAAFDSKMVDDECWIMVEAQQWIQERCEHPDFYVRASDLDAGTEVECPEHGPATGKPAGGATTCMSRGTQAKASTSSSSSGGLGSTGYGTSATVCGGIDTVKGIDISYWQGTIDWRAVAGEGVKFAFIRASYADWKADPQFAANWLGAKQNRIFRGAYHFFRADMDARVQAELFLSQLGTDYGELPPVIDVEMDDTQHYDISRQTWIDGITTWINIVEAKVGRKPMIYTSPGFWSGINSDAFKEYPLWVAHWGPECPSVPAPWGTWQFWQTSGGGTSVAGINAEVDADVFNGNLAELESFAK